MSTLQPTPNGIATIRRRLSAKLARMTPEQAREVFERARLNDGKGPSMDNATIRELTGGYCSQSLNEWAMRKIAARAGLLPKGSA
jgi:hypothetical protein